MSDFVLDIGSTYFDEPGLLTIGSKDILYNHVKLSRESKVVTVFWQFENYIAMPGSPYKGGNLVSVGASKGVSLFKDRVSANTSLALTYDTGGFGCDSGLLLRGTAELDFAITKHITVILPSVNYYAPLTVRDSRTLDAVVSAGLAYRF